MRVRDVMTEGVKTIAPTVTAEDAWTLMRLHSIHHLVVTSVILSWSSLATSPVSSPSPTCSNALAVVSIAKPQ